MKDLSGQTINSYELHELIGEGGFGAVYRAHQSVIRRDVAMKIVLPQYANHPEFIRRFEYEAQLIARLEHIHIVPLYDYWRKPDSAYLIMRLLRGGSLRSMLREGPIDIHFTVRMVDQIASALGLAHRRGVVHRDLKPDNILFDEERNAYLADFGIAKDLRDPAVDEVDEGATLTGSPFYLSPEQAQGKPVTAQSDLYSLGMVIYEMLVGQPPFMDDRGLMAILLHHINDPVPLLTSRRFDLPSAVDVVIQRATAKDPESRYPDANSMALDFRRALVGAEAEEVAASIPIDVMGGGDLDDVLIITTPISPATIIIPEGELVNPYKGLQPFEEADAEDFYGRATLIDKLIERMKEPGDIRRFLAVIGPSGSGKSSVVKAGLIPALRKGALPDSDCWYMIEMVPGTDPFRELGSALLSVCTTPIDNLQERLRTDAQALVQVVDQILPEGSQFGLLLTIDQFEEVFTQLNDEAARTHFLNLLLMAIADPNCRIRILITLRADFFDRPLLYAGFGEMVRRRNEVVLPLSPDEMREAIMGPAERAGVVIESGLVAAIMTDLAAQPGALPLMQYALTEVFERRDGNVLTLDAYRASGGVLGALARRAEDLYQETATDAQDIMRQVFLRLVNLGDGAEDTRRRAHQSELMAVTEKEDVVNGVLDKLGKYRLLTFDHDPETRAPTVAVAHEALIREWPRLRGWLDDSRDDIRLQRRLSAEVEQWQTNGRDASFLATGVRLQQYEVLVAQSTVALTPDERDYVRASVAERERLIAEEEARQARERARERRIYNLTRTIAIGAAVAAVIMLVLAILALASRQEAQDQRTTAEYNADVAARNAEVSDSLALVASAQKEFISDHRDLALALALKSVEIPDPPVEAQLMLAQAAFSPGMRRIYPDHGTYVFDVDVSADGTQMISGSFDKMVFLWDIQSGEVLRRFEGHENWVRGVAYCPGGQTFVSGDQNGVMILWNIETGAPVFTMQGHEKAVRGVACSPDGATALTASEDNTLILWDLDTGEAIRTLEGHSAQAIQAAYSPDGATAVSASYDSTLILWDLDTGEAIQTISGHEGRVFTVSFSPDGQFLLSGGTDRTIRMWSVETGEEVRRFQGHGAVVKTAIFNQDQRLILSSSDDGTIRIWNADTGDELDRFLGHTGQVEQVLYTPGETQMVSASLDGTLRLWDLTNGAEIRRLVGGHTAGVLTADISRDGSVAVTGGFDGMVTIWDMQTGDQVGQFDGHAGSDYVEPLVIGPDGALVASAGPNDDNSLLVWNLDTQEIVYTLLGHENNINSAFFSPDGSMLVSVSQDRTFIAWDMATGEQIYRSAEFPDVRLRGVAFSPDGQRVAVAVSVPDNNVVVLDVATWEPVFTLEGHTDSVNEVRFSPDGARLVTASDDTEVILWDAATGALIERMQGHTAAVSRVVFSPGGQTIASSSEDGTVRLWDAATGRQVRQFDNGSAVNALAYPPDGETVLSGADDTTVRLWDATLLTLSRLLDWTFNNRHIPELTCLQREQYRTTPLCDDSGIYPTSTPYVP